LNRDILSAIFMLNTIRSPETSLYTTCYASQVCREWRNILLDSPTIWGRLLDLDSLQWGNNQWRREVLRRSGTSTSLWIFATSLDQDRHSANKLKAFLFSILDDHWERVERLVIAMDVTKIHPSHWRAIYTPAPRLQVFDVRFYGIHNKGPPSDPLFNDVAPLLHAFRAEDIKFRCQAPWLSVLRSLHIKSSITVADLLKSLEMMPLLTTLRFDRSMATDPVTDVCLPSVSLPKLNHITLWWLNPVECNTLLQHVTPRRGCSLKIYGMGAGVHSTFPENFRSLSRFAEEYYDVQKPSIISLDIASKTFRFELKGALQDQVSFSVDAGWLQHFEALPPAMISNLLTSCTVPSVKALSEIELRGLGFSDEVLTVGPALFTFTAIVTLSCSERILRNIFALEDKWKSTLFPLLKHLKLDALNSSYFMGPNGDVSHFLRSRRDASRPIQTLDLMKCNPDVSPRLSYLEEMTGLKILWQMWGSEENFEYVCGSGHPEKIPFRYGSSWFRNN
jgi:hypothetical protein